MARFRRHFHRSSPSCPIPAAPASGASWRSPAALDAACNTLTVAKAIGTAVRLEARVLNPSLTGLLEVAPSPGAADIGALPVAGSPAPGLSACAAPARVEQGVDCGARDLGAAESDLAQRVAHK